MTSQFANMTSSLVLLTLVCFSCQSLVTGPRFLAISWLALSSETLWKYSNNAMIYFIATTNIAFHRSYFSSKGVVISNIAYQNGRDLPGVPKCNEVTFYWAMKSFVGYLSGYQNICHKYIRGKKTCSYLKNEKKRAK